MGWKMDNAIWYYGKNEEGKKEYALYTEDEELKDRIVGNKGHPHRGFKGCRLHNTYYENGKLVGWDIIFPREAKTRIESLAI